MLIVGVVFLELRTSIVLTVFLGLNIKKKKKRVFLGLRWLLMHLCKLPDTSGVTFTDMGQTLLVGWQNFMLQVLFV